LHFVPGRSIRVDERFDRRGSDAIKRDVASDAVNRLLRDLVLRSTKAGIRDYFYIGVIGYSDFSESAFGGALAGQELAPISMVANNPLRIEDRTCKVSDGAGGIVDEMIKFPIWLEPKSSGWKKMCSGLDLAKRLVEDFCRTHPNSFSPLVLNITDGDATNGDPEHNAREIASLGTNDGKSAFVCGQQFETTQLNLPKLDNGTQFGVLVEASSCLDISADGKRLVTAGFDGTVRLWDTATGKKLTELKGHSRRVTSIGISRDGQRAVSASDDGTVRIWQLPK
jgi:hypothetical protein